MFGCDSLAVAAWVALIAESSYRGHPTLSLSHTNPEMCHAIGGLFLAHLIYVVLEAATKAPPCQHKGPKDSWTMANWK